MKRILFLLVCVSCSTLSFAQKHFSFTANSESAYEKAMNLRMTEAKNFIAQERLSDPDNLLPYLIEDYCDFFTVFVHEKKDVYESLKKNKNRRLELIEKGPDSSPWKLYTEADIHLHWALLDFRFGNYLSAFRSVNTAFRKLKRNQEQFPDFMPNYKSLGILHAAVGTVPDNYKWGLEMFSSLEGTIAQGQKEIEKVLLYAEKHKFVFEAETQAIYAYLLLHLKNNSEGAWKQIQDHDLQPETNPLHCFLAANIAMHSGRNDEAIRILNNRPRSRAMLSFPYLNFMLGTAYLRKLDASSAIPQFEYWLNNFEGRHFIKEAHQKIAWAHLIQNDKSAYQKEMQILINKGYAEAGGDKSALKEAQSGLIPDVKLLQARLLFDGAYYQKAYDLLKNYKMQSPSKHDRIEYAYRLGRILHGAGKVDDALRYYDLAISEGRNETWFFACNAALQAGKLLEKNGNRSLAIQYYKKCLEIKPDEYRTGLHQQAKAGLDRLK